MQVHVKPDFCFIGGTKQARQGW